MKKNKKINNNQFLPYKPTPSKIICNFFGIQNNEIIFKELFYFVKNNLAQFGTTTIAIATVFTWILKTISYNIQAGKLFVYNIDTCYIKNDDSFFSIFIIILAGLLFVFILNYCLIYIHCYIENQPLKTFMYIFMFFIEFLILFYIFNTTMNNDLITLINYKNTIYTVSLITLLLLMLIEFNSLAIFAIKNYKKTSASQESIITKKEKSKKKVSSKKKRKNSFLVVSDITKKFIKSLTLQFTIIIIISLVFSYYLGIQLEKNRIGFNVIQEEATTSNSDSDYIFSISDSEQKYFYFTIVYENKDIYIVCPLKKTGDSYIIDRNCHKVIDKLNQSVHYYSDIYNLEIY